MQDLHCVGQSFDPHVERDTRKDRFQFIFTPKHASWLNLIEVFFSKMARQSLRGLRVNSKEALRDHIAKWIEETNVDPVPFRWRWKLDEVHELINSLI